MGECQQFILEALMDQCQYIIMEALMGECQYFKLNSIGYIYWQCHFTKH